MIDGKTRICGLIGNPVEHTLSPLIHNTLAKAMGLNLSYAAFRVEEAGLEQAVKGAFALNMLGMNVTVPYKNAVIPFLSSLDPLAAQIGAVNTLVREEGGFRGYNTDMTGLYRALLSEGIGLAGEEVILLGAGGAARSVAFLCAGKGAAKVYLLNRSLEKAVLVAEEVNRAAGRECVVPLPLDGYTALAGEKRYLAIQGTSVGLSPHDEEAVITDPAFYGLLHTGYDLIYNPARTRFMRLVSQAGGKACNGFKMLLYQGVEAFERWTDTQVPEAASQQAYELMKKELGTND